MMNKAIDVDVISIETACPICGHEYTAVFADHELAQLRADLHAAQERIAEFESGDLVSALLEANQTQADTIIAQARQLAEARKAMMAINDKYDMWCDAPEPNDKAFFFRTIEISRVWLAANPAPQIDDQNAADRFNDWRKEHEEDFSRRIESAS